MPEKLDLKKMYKHLYQPPKRFELVDVPPLRFLMLDGRGDPNTSPEFAAALQALYSLSYTLKFAIKKAEGLDYPVMALEGLWWAEDMETFLSGDKSNWLWTLMIMQPEAVTPAWFEEARRQAAKKVPAGLLAQVRLETYHEGLSAQILYTGSYSAEGPTIAAMHDFLAAQGLQRRGKHHEIYLSDFRRTAPEKLLTVLRQPAEK
jgi:hypothetical protein